MANCPPIIDDMLMTPLPSCRYCISQNFSWHPKPLLPISKVYYGGGMEYVASFHRCWTDKLSSKNQNQWIRAFYSTTTATWIITTMLDRAYRISSTGHTSHKNAIGLKLYSWSSSTQGTSSIWLSSNSWIPRWQTSSTYHHPTRVDPPSELS